MGRIFHFWPQKICILEKKTAKERPNDGAVMRVAVAQRVGLLPHKETHSGLAVSEPFLHKERLG